MDLRLLDLLRGIASSKKRSLIVSSMLKIIQDSTHDSLNKNLKLEIGVYVVLVLQVWCRWT
jgi:hypothetical protein